MSELYDPKQDIDFVRGQIQQQELGPYDQTPVQPLELDLSQDATRISYELAVNLLLEQQDPTDSWAEEIIEPVIADFTSPEVAKIVSHSALQDVRELNDR